MSMRILSIGEEDFCDMFAIAGTECFICGNSAEAARFISERDNHEEVIFISESIVSQRDRDLETLLNDPGRIIIPLPSSSYGADGESTRSLTAIDPEDTWD